MYEIKEFTGSIKDVDRKSRIVTGYLSPFGGEPDAYGDIPLKGMFTKTIMERKDQIFFLNQHNWTQPHGKFNVLVEDEKGLYFESNPLPNTTYSNDAIELYSEGILKEHSYGYETIKSKKDEKGNRLLQEVKLYEGSNVTLGANSNTPFTGFKGLTIDEINDKSSKIIKMLKTGTLTDDTFLLLEIALKQLQLEAYELGKTALKEPPKEGTQDDEPLRLINEFNERFKTK